MIEVEGLYKSFSGVVAVHNVTFRAHPGEVFGLLGANGAGKTTTLRMIATLLTPDQGAIRVAGHDARGAPAEVRRHLGFVSTTTGLYGRLTARELLRYFAGLHGVDRPTARVDALIERFGIGEFARVRCDRLSTGMRQKVSIARALVHDPPVLVLDEPTNGLDVIVAQSFLELVEEARAQGRCVVYSTHIMSEAERLCDRIGVLHGGQILASGTLDELRARTGEHYLERVFIQLVKGRE